ncbi:Calreticulin [Caligus rogercresseyi]|uniref:Calreticulin n=1 Tax=Caligus rogercresseyi TaxID=217165 RepID=A0A7T8HFS2_CALRO|nr:Calreticulin [Caligus rogercresseyi]
MDGEWEPSQIDNPEYKGEWKPRQIDNPAYKGKWIHPEIENPEYKPEEAKDLGKYKEVCALGFDLCRLSPEPSLTMFSSRMM